MPDFLSMFTKPKRVLREKINTPYCKTTIGVSLQHPAAHNVKRMMINYFINLCSETNKKCLVHSSVSRANCYKTLKIPYYSIYESFLLPEKTFIFIFLNNYKRTHRCKTNISLALSP